MERITDQAMQRDGTALWLQRYPLPKLAQIKNEYESKGLSYLFVSLTNRIPVPPFGM